MICDSDIELLFEENEEVTRETFIEKGLLANSGKKAKRPIKILGEGDISKSVSIKAHAVSASAKEKLEAANCTVTILPGRTKWTRQLHKERLAAGQNAD